MRQNRYDKLKYSKSLVYPDYYVISGVPGYNQSSVYIYGTYTNVTCIPCSMSNIIGYWDANGYGNLAPSINTEYYIKQNIYYALLDAGGTTSNSNINSGFSTYVSNNGSYYYSGFSSSSPAYNDLKAEIYGYESPCLIGIPVSGNSPYSEPHMTTGIGYDCVIGARVIVQDNHHGTTNIYLNWIAVDFMFSFSVSNPW